MKELIEKTNKEIEEFRQQCVAKLLGMTERGVEVARLERDFLEEFDKEDKER